MKIVAIIQARMGSTRLPAKVMMDVMGKPMLWHVINRLQNSKHINQVVVATSLDKKNEDIENFCKEYGFGCYRGSEQDVLDRYYQTAKYYKADLIVRITADCPLIDYMVVDKVIESFLSDKQSLVAASNVIERTYPRGLDTEVFTKVVLEQMWENAHQAYQREHVTSYMYENPDVFNVVSVVCHKDFSDLRWTVDEQEDLDLVKKIYENLYQDKEFFVMEDILSLLEKKTELKFINQHILQKKINNC